MNTKTPLFPAFLLTLLLSPFISFGQSCTADHQHHPAKEKESLLFIPNQNQWESPIQYRVELGGMNTLFMEDRALTWLFHAPGIAERMHENKAGMDTMTWQSHAYKVHFVNAGPAKITGQDIQRTYHNYFLGKDPERWAGKVPVFHGVTYEGLYPGIQMAAYSQNGHFKYDFILESGVDPAIIQLNYEGTNGLSIKEGNLHIRTAIEQITEQKPYAYQVINGVEKVVDCEYHLDNHTISFRFPKGYNKMYPLVIDPVVVAATLSGGVGTNWGFTATYDNAGNIYAGGIMFGVGYPTTLGAFQSNYSGGFSGSRDIVVTKYVPDGSQQIYATYIGGTDNEQPHSMIVDFNSQLSIYGTSESDDYPTTVNSVQPNFGGGGADIVITKLNTDGSALVGSTYLGGSNTDGVNNSGLNADDENRGEIVLDAQGNIYVASCSSSSNFPVTANAFQTNNNGIQDVVVMKLNSDLSTLFWATFIGSPGNDTGLGLRVTDTGQVVVTGMAGGQSFPVGTGGYQPNWPGGSNNAFIVKLSTDGQTILDGTFFGSTTGSDYAYFIDLDEDDNAHIYGQTTGTIDITPNTYFANPGSKQFIAGFSPDLSSLIYSTVIGKGPGSGFDFVPVAFMVDKCNGIYLSGFHAESGLPTTPDAVYLGNDVFYLAKLSPNAETLDFATYYGDADHVDGGTSRFDKAGIVYQGVCSCAFINAVMNTLPNAYSTVNGPECSIGVFKIDFEIETVTAAAYAEPATSGCVPLTIDFQYTGSDAETFFWDFGTGATSTEENPSYTFTEAGTYQVMQVVNAPNTCNGVDTFFLQIDVLDNSSTLTDTIFCPGNVDLFLDVSTANAVYTWQDGATGATYQVNSPGTYWVDVNIGTCSRRDSFMVASTSAIFVDIGEDDSFCDTPSFTLDASYPTATAYEWSTGEITPMISVGTSGEYIVTLYDSIGCFVMDTINLLFTNTPVINLGPDLTPCEGEELLLDATTPGATYTWQDGSTNPNFTITTSGTYTVSVNLNGCIGTDEMMAVFSPPLPLDLGVDQSICDNLSFTLDATTPGAVSYQWANGITNPNIDITTSGNYAVTITNSLGCETIDDINIIFSMTPEIQLSEDTILCEGETLTITPTVTTGVPYSWQDGSTTINYTISSEGLYWALADANGCFDSDSILVTYSPLPVVDYDITEVDCYDNNTATITAINPTSVFNYEFLWSTGSTESDLSDLPAGTYQVTITNENDCIYETEITITQPDPLAIIANPENIECFGDDDGFITIDSIGGGTPPYLYSINGDTLTGNVIYANLDGGWYTVSAQDANDCVVTTQVQVYEPPQIFLSAGEDKIIQLGDSVQIDGFLFPDFNQLINWTSVEYVNCLDCIQPYGVPLYTANFVVTSVDSITGCTLRDTMQIVVEKPRNIYIPNVFSPNGDGVNDLFFPYGDISAQRVNLFRIYDRWGELVHEAGDFDLGDPVGGWDGKLKGQAMNPGVFAYVVEVVFVDGVVKMYKGDVSILR